MIELKVQCDCGQKYKFDVEPVNDRMPFTVACPVCGKDGTAKANAILQQSAVYQIPSSAAAVPPPPPPPLASVSSGLRVNIPSVGSANVPPPPIAPVSVAPVPAARSGTSFAARGAAAVQEQPGRKPSFALGLLGGFLGALVGATIYYFVFKISGWRIGLLAIGVGALAGWSADFLGRGEGSKELGGITAILVVVGVIGAQYFVALGWWHDAVHKIEDLGYTANVAEAKEVVKAIPTGSDGEIRQYLFKQRVSDADEQSTVKTVTDAEVKDFRQNQLREYQDLASGKETREQYLAKNGIDSNAMKKFQDTSEDTFKDIFLVLMFSKMGIFSLIVAAGLAYKMSTNA